jgi:hypothetical protein
MIPFGLNFIILKKLVTKNYAGLKKIDSLWAIIFCPFWGLRPPAVDLWVAHLR